MLLLHKAYRLGLVKGLVTSMRNSAVEASLVCQPQNIVSAKTGSKQVSQRDPKIPKLKVIGIVIVEWDSDRTRREEQNRGFGLGPLGEQFSTEKSLFKKSRNSSTMTFAEAPLAQPKQSAAFTQPPRCDLQSAAPRPALRARDHPKMFEALFKKDIKKEHDEATISSHLDETVSVLPRKAARGCKTPKQRHHKTLNLLSRSNRDAAVPMHIKNTKTWTCKLHTDTTVPRTKRTWWLNSTARTVWGWTPARRTHRNCCKNAPCFSPTKKHKASSISTSQSSDWQNSLAKQRIHEQSWGCKNDVRANVKLRGCEDARMGQVNRSLLLLS